MKRSSRLYVAAVVMAVIASLCFLTVGYSMALPSVSLAAGGKMYTIGKGVLGIAFALLSAVSSAQLFCRAKDAEKQGS